MKQLPALIITIVVTLAAGFVGSLATRRAPEFYMSLARPSWAPPAAVFGPVWTALYILMAIAAWLVWKQEGLAGARGSLALFGAQLFLNAIWSWIFFAWRRGTMAEVEIVILLAMILATMIAFWRIRPLSSVLLVPYIAWVSYATCLTFALVARNRDLLS